MKRKNKKIVKRTAVIVFGLMMATLQETVYANEQEKIGLVQSHEEEENEEYRIEEKAESLKYGDYEYTIKSENKIEITKYKGNDAEVIIPSEIDGKRVTTIGSAAFVNCRNLTSIILPEGITGIGSYAFDGCYNLSRITVPDSLKSISEYAFYQCKSLESITLPKNLTYIGQSAFYECSSLSGDIIIPEGVEQIHSSTFSYCSNLNSITLPKGLKLLGSSAFYQCSSLSGDIVIPGGVDWIYSSVFSGCSSLSNVIILEGVKLIGPSAFSECSSLKGITIPESVKSISFGAFEGCVSLSNITIPSRVGRMTDDVLKGCSGLTQITNNSAESVKLNRINKDVCWYNTETNELIEELGMGSAVAVPKFVEISKTDAALGNDSRFADGAGNNVDTDNVVIVKSIITQEQEDIIRAVEEITQNAAGMAKVFYYDISAYINADKEQPAVLSGEIALKLEYPFGITKDHDIIVLYNAVRINDENVNQYDGYFTLKTDNLGAFTVIALEAEATDENPVHAFVNRLYTLVLARKADEIGLESWTDALITGSSNGVDIGYGFVFSDECKEKNLSNEDFVEILYNTFMNRPSDEGGKASWVSQLDAGVEREKVFAGFIYSVEFADICSEYKIEVGNVFEVGRLADALAHYRNQNADITKFVARCYTEALGREYEPDGLEAWCKVIIEKSNTPKQAAQSFIFSDEFLEKNLNNEEYVKVLYRTFMGREADEVGLAGWIEVLESGREDRMKVMEGFSDSVEFDGILRLFGLD